MISEAAIQFGMQDALQQLGIKEINEGTSTGSKWFSNGKIIESYSPATGDLIGKVKSSTKEDFSLIDSFFKFNVFTAISITLDKISSLLDILIYSSYIF